MALREINVEWGPYIKSYASETTLRRALDKVAADYPEHNDRFIVVRTPEGRWTAVVRLDLTKGGYIGRYDFLKI